DHNGLPKGKDERPLPSLMTEDVLSDQGARPTAAYAQQVQRAFGSAPLMLLRGQFVKAICQKGDQAGKRVEREHDEGEPLEKHQASERKQEAGGDPHPRRDREPVAHKYNVVRLRSPPVVDLDGVRHDLVLQRRSAATGERTDMD